MFRTYFKKNNTIISNSIVNTGRNEITELVYGNIPSISSSGDTIYTRYLFAVDIDSLKEYVNKFNLNLNNLTHKLRLYNTIKLQPEIINEKLYDFNDRSFGITLNLYKISEDFTEGVGHDFLYRNTLNFVKINDSISTQPSNWFKRDLINDWSYEGAISHSGSTLVGSKYFNFGDEDFEIDFTDEINNHLSGNTSGDTYVLTYAPEIEVLDDTKLNKIHFFSKYTNSFFEPHVETLSTNRIRCNNSELWIGEENNICFFSDCQPTGITVFDECDEYFVENITGITTEGNNFYSFDLNIPLDTPDIVNYLFEVECSSGETYDFELTTKKRPRKTKEIGDIFRIRINGIYEGEKIKRGFVRKLTFNYNSIAKSTPEKILFRIFVKQGQTDIDIFDWQEANFYDGEYFVYLDTSWMIPKEYFIETKAVNGVYDLPDTTIRRFYILDEKVNIFY